MIDFEAKRKKAAAMDAKTKQTMATDFAKVKKPITPLMAQLSGGGTKPNIPAPPTMRNDFAPINTNDRNILPSPYNNAAEHVAYEIGKGVGSEKPNTILGGLKYNLARGAQGAVGAVEGITDFAVGNLDTGLSWLTSLGNTKPNAVSEWWKKGAQSVYDTNISQAMEAGINDKAKTVIPKWTKVGGDIYNVAGNMMTSIGAGKALSGVSNIAQATAGKLAIGASAGGNAATQAHGEGASVERAAAFGNAAGTLEATIESLSGGIPGLGKGVVDKAISKFVKYPKALQVVADIVGEGGEEVLSDIITPYLQRIIYNPGAEDATLEEMAQDFAMGAALSGLMQGAQGIGNINLGKAQDIAQSPVSTTTNTQDVATQPIQPPTIAPSVFEGNLPVETQNATQGITEPINNLPQGTGAASFGFDPYTNMQNRYGNIPVGENPARVVDTPLQTADDNMVSRGVRTAMEAQATPDTALEDIQSAVVEGKFSYMPVTDEAAKGRAEQTIQQKGWDNAVKDWTADARSGKVSKDLIVEGQMLYNNAMNAGDTKGGVDILVDLVKMSRSGAQATQANRVLKTLSPEYQLYALQRSVQSMSDELTQKFAKKGFKGITLNEALVKEYMDAQTQKARDTAMDGIKNDIASQIPSTWMDKWNAWRYLSMLGNPRTHVRNIVGNAGFAPVRMIKNTLALGIERVSGVKNRTKAALTFKDSPLIKHAFSDYNEVSEQIMSLGKMDNFAGDINSRRQIFKNPLLEGARNFNTKALDTEDVWFAKPAYASALAGWYKANGVKADALAKGEVSQATIDKARAYAIREAQRATYRDSNAFSDWVSKLGRGYTGDNWAAKSANVLVEGVLPFKRTPANILARAVEYSPVGLTKGLTSDLIKVHNGNMEAWQAIDNISAGLTGTALLGLGAYLASMGLLSGGASDDEKQRGIDKLTGWQEYALNIGGKSITLDWLAPEALPLFVGVELWNAATDKGEGSVSLMTFLDRLGGITEPMFEMSMLQGVNDLFDSIKYSDKNSLVGVSATAAANYLSQGLPTLFGQVERAFEPERKSTYINPKSDVPTSLQYMLGKASGKVPFWEYQQSVYRDGFGNTQPNGTVGQRLVNNLLNPAYVNNVKSDKVTDELQRLNDKNYLESVPGAPKKSFDYGGKEHNLTPEEYSQFQKTAGGKSYDLVSELLKDRGYKKLNDEKKAELVENIMGYAKDTAKREYVGKKYKSGNYETVYKAEKIGISPADYYMYKTYVKEIDPSEKPTQFENAQAIQKTDLSTQYKGKLWELQNGRPSDKNPFTGALAEKGMAPEESIAIMEEYSKLDEEMESYVKGENGPGKAHVQAAYFLKWLEQRGYNAAERSAIYEVFKVWNNIPVDKPSKKANSYVWANPR